MWNAAQWERGGGRLRRRRGEYSRTGRTDGRVRDRIVRMHLAWLKKMGEVLTVIFPTKAEQKAADRLLSNPRISMEHILAPRGEANADR